MVAEVESKLAYAKLGERTNINHKFTCEPTDLIPIVAMTFLRKLNQPVIWARRILKIIVGNMDRHWLNARYIFQMS